MSKGTVKTVTEKFIECDKKWVRVIAGPGTGKSYCMKKRLEHMVNAEGIDPERILVLTFTSIAVQDLKKDIMELQLGNIDVTTLHSLSMRILESEKKHARLMLDFEANTMLYDLEPEIGKVQNKKRILAQVRSNAETADLTDDMKTLTTSRSIWLKQHHGLHLDDVISEVCDLLKNHSAARRRWNYDRVLVDEYQDLNVVEQEFVDLLVSARGKLTVIGDDDQSIYEFKGAFPDGIRHFEQNHPGCEDIRFTECRRCPSAIVEKANLLISNNSNRTIKEFTAWPDNQVGSIEIITAVTPSEEIEKLCTLIQKESEQLSPGQIVVLAPTVNRGRVLFDALKEYIPDVVFCFRDADFDSKENRDNISLLTLAANPEDLISWRYLLGCESRTRLADSYKRIREYSKKEKIGLLETLEKCASGEIRIPYTSKLISRYNTIKEQVLQIRENPRVLLDLLSQRNSHYSGVLSQAIDTMWCTQGLSAIRSAVLDAIFSSEAAASSKYVRIMSLHAAKGLSAKVVIIMSAVEKLIPLANSNSIEEQRRLFYVAVTRCKGGPVGHYPGKLIISTFSRSEDGNDEYEESRFIKEMNVCT